MDPALLLARYAGPPLLGALATSWRFRELAEDGSPAHPSHRVRSAIYVVWHAQLLPLTLRHRGQGFAVIVSRHRDGEIISRIIERMGFRAIRGSSTRGGAAALLEFTRASGGGGPLAITTDGPQGPARRCKPGAIQAAALTGLPIVPAAAAPVHAWRFGSWDEFMIPRPGTRVFLNYGSPLTVPRDLARSDLPRWQDIVTEAQNRASRVCEDAARCQRTPE